MSRRVQVLERDTAPARSTPTNTGVAFIASLFEKGTFDPQRPCLSLDDVQAQFGSRQSYGLGWDWLELFFRRGGGIAYVSPVKGPAAVKASANLAGSAGTTLIVRARSEGEWGNGAAGGLSVEVANGPAGATTRVLIIRRGGVEVERTLEATTQQGVIDAGATLEQVTVEAGAGTASLPTVAAAANLAGGTLDRANITQAQVDAALALFGSDLGPGQVVSPDWQTSAAHGSLGQHAADHNRFAVCDTVRGATRSALDAAGDAVQGGLNSSRMAAYAPWLRIAGTGGGAERYVPTSGLFCAAAATTDAVEGANQVPAGEYGRAVTPLILGVSDVFSDADAAELEAHGINLAIVQNFEVRLDGNRTLVDVPGVDSEWKQIGNARFRMALAAELDQAAEPFAHRRITPVTIAALDAALTGVMIRNQASLYPGENDPGFIVDTGPSVNTPTKIADDILSGAVGYRPAPGADLVQIYVTKVGVADTIG